MGQQHRSPQGSPIPPVPHPEVRTASLLLSQAGHTWSVPSAQPVGRRLTESQLQRPKTSLLPPPAHLGGGWEVGRRWAAHSQPTQAPSLGRARTCMPSLHQPPGAWLVAVHTGFHGAHSCHAICSTAGSPGPCALRKWPQSLACAGGGDAGTRPTALGTEGLWGSRCAGLRRALKLYNERRRHRVPSAGTGAGQHRGDAGWLWAAGKQCPEAPASGRSAPGPLDPKCSAIILRAPAPSPRVLLRPHQGLASSIF